jgi:hypothetical protein
MKKLYILLLFMFAIHANSIAQENRKEEIEKFRKEYFTRQLNLTAEEAKKFWPVYNDMQAEFHKLQKEKRSRMRTIREDFESMSDVDLEKSINDELVFRQKELDLDRRYHERYKAVLSVRKLALYYRAQEGFKRELLKQIKDKGGRGPRGPEND